MSKTEQLEELEAHRAELYDEYVKLQELIVEMIPSRYAGKAGVVKKLIEAQNIIVVLLGTIKVEVRNIEAAN